MASTGAMAAVGAVVTGGAGGLGRAVGAELVRRGHRVRLADLDPVAAEDAAAGLGSNATGVRLDVTDGAAVRALADEVAATDGLAVWVNNAGILRTGPSWSHADDEVHALFDVNVHGTIHGTTAAIDVMRRGGDGHIVNVVSLAGLVAPPGETVYAATKHAALAYTMGTAHDLRQHGITGLHLTAICPDGIWTPMLHDLVDDPEAALSWSGPLLTPEQVARQVGRALDRRSPVVSVPRWRGGVARAYAAFPRIALRLGPTVVAQARRKQARFAASNRDH
ncbi:SDR family NAD(P)-dependent oxidoreductase [Nitriliruptor alkaliphilus]|uniref:SDR family NAD(P)-dependent oxidoreductase n=1 Tax=Nitriliruptor alkaliphilus TaxID=427918 RepID=UPI000AD11F29|nr:SDR family NAD(P)-dependent oxidoreductase [Nitriliruptor alkaliphilus]